jgi:hypothetical protein
MPWVNDYNSRNLKIDLPHAPWPADKMHLKASLVEGDGRHVDPNGGVSVIVNSALLRRRVEVKSRLHLKVCVVGSGEHAAHYTSSQHTSLHPTLRKSPLYRLAHCYAQGCELELDRSVGDLIGYR